MKGARLLILVPVLLALISLPTAAAPQAGPCGPGTTYDPACDVNHDNQINITDIQLTAGHWNQSGTWVSDNQHDHLGQEWTGTNNPLKLTGSFGAPDYAALMVSNSAGNGVRVSSVVGDGVSVQSTGLDGVYVISAGCDGMAVASAGDDGFYVESAGSPSAFSSSSAHNGFEVAGAAGNGLYVGRADIDGVVIRSTGDDGIQLGSGSTFPLYGLFVPDPGTPFNTLLPNTANAQGEWALYTMDNILAGNVFASAQTLVAVVGGDQPLAAGDVVTAIGLADPVPGSLDRLAMVRLAGSEVTNVVGVVSSRMALQPLPGKEGVEDLRSVAGPAQPGDYVAITVLGVVQVKVQATETIQPGQRLTAADTPGHARALRTVQVEGIRVDESGPTLGAALEAPQDGMVWVLVNPQ